MANEPTDPAASRIHAGSAEAGTRVRVGADATQAVAAMASVQEQIQKMVAGEAHPEDVRRNLIRQYYRNLLRPSAPGTTLRGHRWAKVNCRVGGEYINIDWEFLPSRDGKHSVLAFCPECYWQAPMGVQTAQATRPVFFDEQLGRVPGNPESDLKFVAFQIQATSPGEIYFNENDRLCIDRIVYCPQVRRCGWIVKVSNGIVSVQSRRTPGIVRLHEAKPSQAPIVGPHEVAAPTGPIIIKGQP